MPVDAKSSPVNGRTGTPGVHPRVEPLNALTSLRFFAALHVLLFHFFNFSPGTPSLITIGFTGVSFFFVLSGFILSYNYNTVEFDDSEKRTRFYIARIARIYPVYLLALIIGIPFFIHDWNLAQAAKPYPLPYLYLSSAFLAPFGLQAWCPGAACALDCPSWSVSVELFFYALFPFLIPLTRQRPIAVGGFALALWAICYLSYTHLWAVSGGGTSLWATSGARLAIVSEMIRFFPVGRLPEFLTGIVAFQIWHRHQNLLSWTKPLLLFAALAAAILILFFDHISDILLHDGLSVVVWVPLILGAANLRRGWICSRPAVFLGKISYSFYLIHLPVILTAYFVDKHLLSGALQFRHPDVLVALIVCAAILIASFIFIFIEEPGRKYLSKKLPLVLIRQADLPTTSTERLKPKASL